MGANEPCPDCGHVRCPEACVCNCDAARAEEECARLCVERDAWRIWAAELVLDLGRQSLCATHPDRVVRKIIEQLARMAPGVPRCHRCGCFATRHECDDEELRACVDCECSQFEAGP